MRRRSSVVAHLKPLVDSENDVWRRRSITAASPSSSGRALGREKGTGLERGSTTATMAERASDASEAVLPARTGGIPRQASLRGLNWSGVCIYSSLPEQWLRGLCAANIAALDRAGRCGPRVSSSGWFDGVFICSARTRSRSAGSLHIASTFRAISMGVAIAPREACRTIFSG